MNGGTTFRCTFCEHRVTTLDFSSNKGNRRTQAAAAINQHVALSHLRASRTTLWYPKGIVPVSRRQDRDICNDQALPICKRQLTKQEPTDTVPCTCDNMSGRGKTAVDNSSESFVPIAIVQQRVHRLEKRPWE
jgi:hypothetical protein